MKKRELICIVCPNGCQLEISIKNNDGLEVTEVVGQLCEKGPKWAEQEVINPMRTIASSIAVQGGDFPLVSVRTDAPIPLGKILEVMEEIKKIRVKAPVHIGDHLMERPAGTSCNIIATRHVNLIG